MSTENKLLVQVSAYDLRRIIREELAASRSNGKLLTSEELARRLHVPKSWVYEQSPRQPPDSSRGTLRGEPDANRNKKVVP